MKRLLLSLTMMLGIASLGIAQEVTYQLSSHILDIGKGMPAAGVEIALSRLDNQGAWILMEKKVTDANGRIKEFLPQSNEQSYRGVFKLTFYTQPYFSLLGQDTFYPFIEVVFELKDDSHYHVPITVSPFGYSTYRGN